MDEGSKSSYTSPSGKRLRVNQSDPASATTGLMINILDNEEMKSQMKKVSFISLKNHKNNYCLPSTKNYIGGIQFRHVKSDGGCTSLLLCIATADDLWIVMDQFPTSVNYVHKISRSHGVGGESLVLIVNHIHPHKSFEVNLCQDILGENVTCTIPKLRFALCDEDVFNLKFWLADRPEDSSKFVGKKLLDSYVPRGISRKKIVLLGQTILSQFSAVRLHHCEYYFSGDIFPFDTFARAALITEFVKAECASYAPVDFEDMEDDDQQNDDDAEHYEFEE